jgi:hypothetical protein
MTKTSGLGDQLLVGGTAIGGDIQAISRIGGGNTPIDLTDITKSAHARVVGHVDGGINLTSFFDPAAGAAHPVLSALPTADTAVTYSRGNALGVPAASVVAKQIGYDPNRAADGSLMFAVSAVANGYGLEWGVAVSAGVQTDTTGTNGTGVDLTTVSTAFGWQAYLHVGALTGTNVVVTLQDSANNSAFTNLASGAFTSVTSAPAWQRLASGVTDTVRQYVRVVTSGTFTSATFYVAFVRNTATPVF